MVEKVKRASQQALVIALVTLATNAAQWATAREQRLRRDDLLASAFQANTQALEDAQRVLEAALKTCAKRKGIEPQVMFREETTEPDVRALVAEVSPTAMLDNIAADEARRRSMEVLASPGATK